jgi:hypothetical protein
VATLYSVLCALQAQISSVTQGLISNSPDTFGKPLTVQVGLYWPSAKSLQNNVRVTNAPGAIGPTTLITVYDRGLAADSTRWLPTTVGSSLLTNPPDPTQHMSVTPSEHFVQQLATMTLTFAGPIQIGDAVGIVFTGVLGQFSAAVVPIAVIGDTATSMATKAAALLTADPLISTWMTAIAVGPVVTLTSLLASSFTSVSVNVGAGGSGIGGNNTQLTEIGRRRRHFQIVVWSRTADDRITVGDPIEMLIAQLEANFGLTFPDGTLGRLTFSGDTQHDEAVLSDTYRRDFMVCVDYGINVTDVTYSILAPISQFAVF